MTFDEGTEEFNDNIDDAVDALTKRWTDVEGPSEDDDAGATADQGDETAPNPSDEESEAADEAEDASDEADTEAAEDTDTEDDVEQTIVKVLENGVEHEVPLNDLKRLYGQEAAITRKSQEATETLNQAKRDRQVYDAALNAMGQSIQARLDVFKDIDWATAAIDYDRETYDAWRKEYSEIQAEAQQFQKMATDVEGHTAAQRQATAQREWENTQAILQADIPNWGDELLGELAAYMQANLPKASNVTDADEIKVLNKAMLWDRHLAQKAQAKDAVLTKKKATAPKRVVAKSDTSSPARKGNDEALAKLRSSGSTDDAMAALLDRWK